WNASPDFVDASRVPPTNPKLRPSPLAGAGFEFEHRATATLALFHSSPDGRLENVSRGEALSFVTTFPAAREVDRVVLVGRDRGALGNAADAASAARADAWARSFEIAQAEVRRAHDI